MTFIPTKTQSMAPDGRRGSLVVGLRRTATGEVYLLDAGPRRWVVGSEGSCDVQIGDDPFVSGVHCVLERKPSGVLVVRDRESRNGTFVDGNPIEGAELRVGSYLSIGRTTLVAVAGAGSAAQPRALELLRGRDPVLRRTVEQALKAAQSECSVLILGETGTGKDLLARVIHESSRRSSGAFVAVNCGAIPRELIASELFGHEKGAFTGATETRDGYFMEANGGTLFLDEMGELPIELQAHLLRVLETKTVRRVGSSLERPVNVRIVAATNRTEGLGTESSRLRNDLYHRLATVVLGLPPLRDRLSDVPELVDALLDELTPDYGRKQLTHEAWIALQRYSWPGNVRELRHAVARAVTLGGDTLEAHDFFTDGMGPRRRADLDLDEADPLLAPYESMMRGAMEQALAQYGSIRAAAAALGMPKSTFADRARQYGIVIRKRPRAPEVRRAGGSTLPLGQAAVSAAEVMREAERQAGEIAARDVAASEEVTGPMPVVERESAESIG